MHLVSDFRVLSSSVLLRLTNQHLCRQITGSRTCDLQPPGSQEHIFGAAQGRWAITAGRMLQVLTGAVVDLLQRRLSSFPAEAGPITIITSASAPLLRSSTGLPVFLFLRSLRTLQEQPWLLLEGLRAMRLLLVLPESAKTAHRAGQQNRASRLAFGRAPGGRWAYTVGSPNWRKICQYRDLRSEIYKFNRNRMPQTSYLRLGMKSAATHSRLQLWQVAWWVEDDFGQLGDAWVLVSGVNSEQCLNMQEICVHFHLLSIYLSVI